MTGPLLHRGDSGMKFSLHQFLKAVTGIMADNHSAGTVNGLTGRKRYLRVVATVATAACDLGVDVILAAARELPVSQVNTVAFSV